MEPETRCSGVSIGRVTVSVDDDQLVLLAGNPRRVLRGGSGLTADEPIDAAWVAGYWSRSGRPSAMELQGDYSLVRVDRQSGNVELLVDRHGHSSIFVRQLGDRTWICTEAFPLLTFDSRLSVNAEALHDIFALRTLTGSHSVWTGIRQAVPGQWLTMTSAGFTESPPAQCYRFANTAHSPLLEDVARGVEDGIRRCIERLRDEGIAEVAIPLSGGVDSAIIAASARRVFPKCRAYTMRMEGFANPEIPRAEEVARRIGIPLSIVSVSHSDIRDRFDDIISRLQEPPRHFNNMPMLCMLKEIANFSPVVLAGDGVGQFGAGGLGTVLNLAARKRQLDRIPPAIRPAAASVLQLGGRRGGRIAALILSKLPEIVVRYELLEMTPAARTILAPLKINGFPSPDTLSRTFFPSTSVAEMHLLWEAATLTRAIFRRNFRLAQEVGLRFVYPLLDPTLLEIAAALPNNLRFDARRKLSKPVLRQVCTALVGGDVATWPKIGFATPEVEWIEGPLRATYEQALNPSSRVAELLDVAQVRGLPIAPNKQTIWTIMTLDAVLRRSQEIDRM